ncbi:MAG: nucleotidyltransferase domain-containing protein, partial [Proteobacteria bacterium]|nr:nucleotidyltransferase domain-containing protein [Pseudomonadota bacterium]
KEDLDFEIRCEAIVKEKILELFGDTSAIIFLFGSRARGNFRRGSDFDIGFESIDYSIFRKLSLQFDLFLEQSIVPSKVDLVYIDRAESGFIKEAKKNMILWKAD